MTTCISPFRRFSRLIAIGALALASLFAARAVCADTATGGFLESDETSVVRGLLSQSTINGFLPQRGAFTFPAPYNTQGIRVTNSSDCGGQDCVDMIYSYWRNMSNSAGSNTMYIFIGLDRNRGGQGPTLFSYDKSTGQLTEVGPLFDSSSSYSWNSGEGWYFSYGMPTKIYMQDGSKLLRYDVLAHTFETVFDSTSQYPNTVIRQTNSSNNDDVHSATLEDASTWQPTACIAYKASTNQFFYFAVQGHFDECQIDKSGRYLEIKEKLPSDPCSSCDEDDVIEDLQAGTEKVLYDQAGAGGHSDLGYGTMVAVDNWNNYANAWRLWDLSSPFPTAQGQGGATNLGFAQGGLVYHNLSWSAFNPSHISYENANTSAPVSQQYACGGAVNTTIVPQSNDIICFLLNPAVPASSEQALIVAPVMTDMSASGGSATCPSCVAYGQDPKGNLDPTGQYFFWVSNMGGSRMDAFIVKVPYQLLTGSSGTGGTSGGTTDTTPPTVSISSPAAGASLTGSVTVSANASDNIGVASVQFKLDGANLGSALTQAPYSLSWDTTAVAAGTHTLTAVATDTSGNTATSSSVSVTTVLPVFPPTISSVASSVTGSSSASVSWTTDQASNSQVAFGTTTAYGTTTTLNTSMVTSHSMSLSGLAASTTYHYQVISANSSGQQSVSADYTFTTQAGGSTTLPSTTANWHLNATSGTTAIDSSGNDHTGTLVNGPAWTAGVAGNGLAFNGTNQYVTAASKGLNLYPLTVSAWFKTSSTSGLHGLVNKYNVSSMNGYQVFMSNGNLCAWYFRDSADYVWDGSGCTLNTSGYADNQWHMVTYTVNSAGGKLYVDGVLKASRAWTGVAGATTSGAALSMARYPGVSSPYLAATLDEVRLYNSALSASQVAALYASFPLVMPVAWTNLVNLTANGGSLTKTGGCDGCEDATANSQQQIALGASGYFEFTASETNTLRYAGLTSTSSGPGSSNIGYAIRLQSGDAAVYEGGIYKTDVSFSSGDVFRIAVGAGVVNYYKNGTVFYTSNTAPSSALIASAVICNINGTITSAVIKTQ
ncbi:MAG: LamG-like jellyroll fold domain-containing protein [Bacillota bacterium]